MKRTNKKISNKLAVLCALCLLIIPTGCKKYLQIPLPVNTIAGSGAYLSDASTSGVVSGLLTYMYAFGVYTNTTGVGYQSALYTDELQSLVAGNAFYTNSIKNTDVAEWTALYKEIYDCNLAIEGINGTKASLVYKNQWLGEALFIRALSYFYLVNIYGDVALTTTSDVNFNNVAARSAKALVYQQIIADLTQAQTLLATAAYHDGYGVVTTDRGRPNQVAATALLARVYLYTGDWANAEIQATTVINNTSYQMVTPASTFLAASKETIWGLAPTGSGIVLEYNSYNNGMPAIIAPPKDPTSYGVKVAMSQTLLNAFETGDTRYANWVRSSTVSASGTAAAATYYFPNKYKASVNGSEYIVMLRLGEQYLIRAEARAQQNNVSGSQADINAVRTRAGLANTTAATQAPLLAAIAKERQTELFTELGNRFFDLKRTGTIDAVMNAVAPTKGATWASYKAIWPIPIADIQANPNLTQAPGFQ